MQKQIPTEATPVGPTKIENAKQQTARFHHKNYSGIERKNLAVILVLCLHYFTCLIKKQENWLILK